MSIGVSLSLASQTKWVLLQLGSQSLHLWVRASGVSGPGLTADTQRTYRRLAAKMPWPDQQVNRVILVFLVLPMAGLYTVLRQRGRTEQQAVDAVTDAVGAVVVGPERWVMRLLVSTGLGRRLVVRAEASRRARCWPLVARPGRRPSSNDPSSGWLWT